MIDINNLIDNYNERYGVQYELRAVSNDGEVLAKYTDSVSADHAAGYAGLLDEKILEIAINDSNERAELAEAV